MQSKASKGINMRNSFFLLCVLLLVGGVSGDKEVEVSVMEGDSVTLKPDAAEEPRDGDIWWKFNGSIIVQIDTTGQIIPKYEVTNGRFKDRLKLDNQTGSLTITNIRTTDVGNYKLNIKNANNEILKEFSVAVHDNVKSLSVMEGDTVTLHTGVTDIQRDDQILWKFGDQVLNSPDDTRWRNIHLYNENGDLTIKNIQGNQSGDYELEINTASMILHRKLHINISDVESVSVMEGDSVTLHTGVSNIQRDDQILWKFEDQVIPIPRLNGPDVKGWRNIILNDQTGELTINNIRIDQTGYYEVNTNRMILHKKFKITVEMSPIQFVSVKEGEPVTLHSDNEIQRDDQILWMFRPEIKGGANNNFLHYEVLDERFRDRLKLDQTGYLTITNTITSDSGLYILKISSSSRVAKYTRFAVTVNEIPQSSTEFGKGIGIGIVIVIVIGIVFWIIVVKKCWFNVWPCRKKNIIPGNDSEMRFI